ncbi:hypothetical protein SLEP1_g42985 [Rubroshorea leprosula]|uniref:Protein POLYCHOME-like n=1 Tax=Rubroshorea leprosula TaxID=152421 RepID=A0AAV5LBJ5_9ROSI|nr:hypothetical protein SLEP1_g42985 [Rubroshorea leprosula]
MAESRDRLERPVDLAEVFARRRSGVLGVLSDESQRLLGSPAQQAPLRRGTGMGVTNTVGRGIGRSGLGTPRSGIGRGRNMYRSPIVGRENSPTQGSFRRGRGRASGSALPSWYSRTPLRDVTVIVRAIERRRARLGEDEGQAIESPAPQDQSQRALDTNFPLSGAQPEHNFCTPAPVSRKKPCPPSILKVSKILHDITSQSTGESESLTPQRKLLNSLDTVEKVVMEELQKLKRTPGAKKAEREKRVRTLMSMR